MILEYLGNLIRFKKIINSDNEVITRTTDNFNISLIALDFLKNDKSLFVVVPNLVMAQKYYDELINIIDDEDVLFYPADELITADMIMSTGDFKFERINTILSLLSDKKKIVVTNYNGAIRYQFNKNKWINNNLHIKVNDSINIEELLMALLEMGYKNVYTTTKTGEFSRRGSIVDIFPLNNDNPIRLDFFGDDLEELKVFDSLTQVSIKRIDNIDIYPVCEMLYSDKELEIALKRLDDFILNNKLSSEELKKYDEDRLSLINRNNLDLLMRYVSFFDNDKQIILDYKDNKKVYLIDDEKLHYTYERMVNDIEDYCSGVKGYSLLKLNYFIDYNKLINKGNIITKGITDSIGFSINAYAIPDLKANPNEILRSLTANYKNKIVICVIENKLRLRNLCDTLLDNNVPYKEIYDINNIKKGIINIITKGYIPSIDLHDDNIIIYNEKTLFEIKYEKRKIKYKSIYKNTVKISRYDELVKGDYVVHYDYGIGKYLGIKTMEMSGLLRDYIHIEYANNDAVYVPLEQIEMIQKYANPDDRFIKVNDISSSAWQRAKMKVRKKVHDISEELIKLYSNRSISKGFEFEPDSTMQLELEADFNYETTPDQEKAINDVKKDMESPHPMDRLVCGDVGYGKTEVALRAAMKAVLSGKQVCVLAPTTILSRQHYYTFKDRMEKYGVHVELINRFISMKKQKEIIAKVKTGEIDVLIGTHRVLSNEIKYHDLGLLIVDEEQRFGVSHKEKIKEIKINVDALTLSATPIPRTLQMSIVGIKDLSMIETPPKNRYPIQTYVLKRNDSVIRDAIIREISRGGQVFYLYNKVEDIYEVASHIASLVSEARVCVGHGQMKKDDLENTLIKFADKEYDVIVCTTIIETGLDMPDVNTMIIHDADCLGLSQLYQIRGRVGRSDKIAYAYLMYNPKKELNDNAIKRLEALKEFSDLGSGFKIAMRDLAIRGAGDLLGSEQSGFIESVGLEMYMKILEDEIKDRKGELEAPKVVDPSLNEVYTSRHIDNNYINNEDVRIEIHKRIGSISSISELDKLILELKDRFGEFDLQLLYYMNEKLFNNLCKKLDVSKIDSKNSNFITIYLSKECSKNIDGNKLFQANIDLGNPIKLRNINNQVSFVLDKTKYEGLEYFIILNKFLDKILA